MFCFQFQVIKKMVAKVLVEIRIVEVLLMQLVSEVDDQIKIKLEAENEA